MAERTIWFLVADLKNPSAEPFAVIKVDTTVRVGSGCQGTVESLHWSRDVAVQIAAQLQSYFDSGETHVQ